MQAGLHTLAAALCSLQLGQPDAGTSPPAPVVEEKPQAGTVYTYYGLRKMELDSNVSDEDKLEEWQAFIVRSREQVQYAQQAVERWKNAARLRVIEGVQKDDQNPVLTPREKMKSWEKLIELYPRTKEVALAKKRIAHWRTLEIKRLVESAEQVERGGGTKVERIQAWKTVTAWVQTGPEARAAQKRIDALQTQIFDEAQSLDKIARVDGATKLAVWRDVLNGAPTPQQAKIAQAKIAGLEGKP